MEPKGQPNEQMEEVVLQPTQPKLVSTEHIETHQGSEALVIFPSAKRLSRKTLFSAQQ